MVFFQVLGAYRTLLRTRQIVFSGDAVALTKSREKIRDSFLANKHLTASEDILQQIQCANETSDFLLQGVVQGKLNTQDNTYKVKITEHTKLHDNVPLKEKNKVDLNNFEIPQKFRKKKN